MKFDKAAIIKSLTENMGDVTFRDLVKALAIDKGGRKRFTEMLGKMVSSGEILKKRGNRYQLPDAKQRMCGTLAVHRNGYGFVTLDAGGEDVFIPARELRGNLHGDRVCVVVEKNARDGRRAGKVISTIEHGQTRIVGRYEEQNGEGIVIPSDPRLAVRFNVLQQAAKKTTDGQVVVAEITAYPTGQRPAFVRITENLGRAGDPETELLAVIRSFDLPDEFSEKSLQEAQSISSEVLPSDLEGRVDLRALYSVTIDGESARDFDDAVAVRNEEGGRTRLWVSIADVAHYVRPGSAIDKDAYLRGTSVYFPDRCLPMLPEQLSNGICSLNPGVARLAMTAEILFDDSGRLLTATSYPSVILSKARLTYTRVRDLLTNAVDADTTDCRNLLSELRTMARLSEILLDRRIKRGSIDFDLPETEVVLDANGETSSIVRGERNLAHRLIEEFMLVANEAIAVQIAGNDVPSLYRIHESPDPQKLNDFRELAAGLGYLVEKTDNITPKELQKLLAQVAGKPEERMINEVLLRCMKQARYSLENLGHFGLASPCYTHFTSPIRRYPDLVVHRILKNLLQRKIKPADFDKLADRIRETAAHTSSRERIAMEAEREIVKLKKLQFMRPKIGEEFSGFVVGVTQYGLYVELSDYFVEGTLPIAALPEDYYHYLEKQHAMIGEASRVLYRIGDQVRVKLVRVDMESRQLEFALLQHVGMAAKVSTRDIDLYPRIPVKGKQPPGDRGKGLHPTSKKRVTVNEKRRNRHRKR